MVGRLSGAQQRRVDEILDYQRIVEKVRHLVAELESSRAAKAFIVNNISAAIERELSRLRQRALTSNIGTLADQAGAMAVLAGRGGSGIAFKIRGLQEGLMGMEQELEHALRVALAPEPTTSSGSEAGA